ncbi:MAG TPA: ABC transporter permease [Allosphingosinicella sp.]|jgi:ABC-2 type transport system permease protein
MNMVEAARVIARRDFVATVYSRSFIFFMVTPILVIGFSILMAFVGARSASNDTPAVAVLADSATVEALTSARARLASLTGERAMPELRVIQPAEDVRVQARTLIADQEAGLSGVFSGTLAQPVLSGPERIDEFVGKRMTLIVEEAQRSAALAAGAGGDFRPAAIQREITGEAAGNLRETRTGVARFGQFIIFFLTILLATMLLSNLIEEKSNKVIEVLAAAVPLDAIFLGKLIAMLGVSLIGIALWVGMFGLAAAFSVQMLPAGMELPSISPAIGWPIYAILLLIYWTTNYMLLGSLFLGIGAQANSVRELQTLNMPVTFLQMGVFVLAMTVVGSDGGLVPMIAYVFPFSSPLSMIARAAESDQLWPHFLAIAWQLLWVFITIRISVGLFRKTVLKSGGRMRIFPSLRPRRS